MSVNSKIINNGLKDIANSGLKKMPSFVKLAQHQLSELKDSEVREVFQNLYEKAFVNKTKKFKNISENLPTIAQKVDMVENPEIKKELLTTLQDLAKKDKKGFKQSYEPQMQYVEDLADAVNVLNDKYRRLDSEPREFYKYLKEGDSWFLDLIDGRKGGPVTYRCGTASDKRIQVSYEDYLEEYKKHEHLNLPQVYQNNLKLDSLRNFYDKYQFKKPEVADTLYNSEYLKTVKPELKPVFEEIKSKYGTDVITSNVSTTKEDAEYVKEELKLWKENGGKNCPVPRLLDVNALDVTLQNENSAGVAFPRGKVAVLDLLDQDTLKKGSSLRHELTHIVDMAYENRPKNDFTILFEKLKWAVLKKLHKKEWDRELENAGIASESHRKYALSSRLELKAVTSEARNYNSFSAKFLKDVIGHFKMPYFIFEMPQNKVREARLMNDFRKQSQG